MTCFFAQPLKSENSLHDFPDRSFINRPSGKDALTGNLLNICSFFLAWGQKRPLSILQTTTFLSQSSELSLRFWLKKPVRIQISANHFDISLPLIDTKWINPRNSELPLLDTLPPIAIKSESFSSEKLPLPGFPAQLPELQLRQRHQI